MHLCVFPAQRVMLFILCWTLDDTSALLGLVISVICNIISVNVSISNANKLIQQLVCACLKCVQFWLERVYFSIKWGQQMLCQTILRVYLRLNSFLNENGTKQQHPCLCESVMKGFFSVRPGSVCHWTWKRNAEKKQLKLIYYLYIWGILLL